VSIVFAMRRVLKKGILPLLFLAAAGWITFALGLFNQSAELYAQRGLEETGRFLVWPLAIERFLGSPLTGVGAGNVATYIPEAGSSITPHNGLIFIALASGIVPLLLFIAWCVQLVVSTYRASPGLNADSPFHRALLLYAFLITMNLNLAFSLPWMMVLFCSVSVAGLVATARRSVTDEMLRARVRARPYPAAVAGQRPL
jgi:O-antigen ligase